MTGPDGPPEATPLELDTDERELLAVELEALLPALEGERRRRYEELAAAVDGGVVPAELVPLLESVVALALQTARARQLYRAEGERILTGIWRRTPAGQELTAHLADVNAALRSLVGHPLRSATVGMRTLGHFTVTLATDAGQLTLAVRPDVVTVESIAVGGAGGPAG